MPRISSVSFLFSITTKRARCLNTLRGQLYNLFGLIKWLLLLVRSKVTTTKTPRNRNFVITYIRTHERVSTDVQFKRCKTVAGVSFYGFSFETAHRRTRPIFISNVLRDIDFPRCTLFTVRQSSNINTQIIFFFLQ